MKEEKVTSIFCGKDSKLEYFPSSTRKGRPRFPGSPYRTQGFPLIHFRFLKGQYVISREGPFIFRELLV